MKANFSFSRRGPDRVSEELASVLSTKGSWEFKSLFDIVHASLRSKDMARGGEEMLRLRAHEKLQGFLKSGIVTKTGKEYTGVPKALEAFIKTAAEFNARLASGIPFQPTLRSQPAEAVAVAIAEVPKPAKPVKAVKAAQPAKAAKAAKAVKPAKTSKAARPVAPAAKTKAAKGVKKPAKAVARAR